MLVSSYIMGLGPLWTLQYPASVLLELKQGKKGILIFPQAK